MTTLRFLNSVIDGTRILVIESTAHEQCRASIVSLTSGVLESGIGPTIEDAIVRAFGLRPWHGPAFPDVVFPPLLYPRAFLSIENTGPSKWIARYGSYIDDQRPPSSRGRGRSLAEALRNLSYGEAPR